jgi:hypothetical protein
LGVWSNLFLSIQQENLMAHDVFISYSSKDKPIADGICANLESAGMRCWIAPRDIAPGDDWPTAITTAISKSKVMVLIFSASSNSSRDVGREIILAANHDLVIIPFKIEDIEPEPGKQYYLADTHWLEAMNPPTQEQIRSLVEMTRAFVPAVVADGLLQHVPAIPPATEKPADPQNRRSLVWVAWLVGAFVLIALGSILWPKMQGMALRPTVIPTLAATLKPTDTLLPSPTSTDSPTAIPTLMSTPFATPSTGTVTGLVKWGDVPYAGVNIMLCSDWKYTCKGVSYSGLTDAQGVFTITGIEPGKYIMIKSVPDKQLGLILPMDVGETAMQIYAGNVKVLDPINQCKYDLQVSTPVINNGYITLRWNTVPGGEYDWEIDTVYWSSGAGGWHVKYTSVTTYKPFPPGDYIWFVSADGTNGYCSRSVGRFTIP